mgnify:CR=1
SGSGSLSFKGYVRGAVSAGIDLGPRAGGQPVDKFLYDYDAASDTGTIVEAGFKILGTGLDMAFTIFDNIGVSVTNGTVTMDHD